MHYYSDRQFTDYVHAQLAMPIIYNTLQWLPQKIDAQYHTYIDIQQGIDYVFKNIKNETVTVQERFRDNTYQTYNDCTLRYRRDANPNTERHASEFFKIKADFLVYGITNGSKQPEKRHTLTNFVKFVVLNLPVLYQAIQNQQIIFTTHLHTSKIESQILQVPIKNNKDNSSSFVAFNIAHLHQLFEKQQIIILQKGFF